VSRIASPLSELCTTIPPQMNGNHALSRKRSSLSDLQALPVQEIAEKVDLGIETIRDSLKDSFASPEGLNDLSHPGYRASPGIGSTLLSLNSGRRYFSQMPIAPHKRFSWEFFAVIRGNCGLLLKNDTDIPLKCSHLWLLPPYHFHGWHSKFLILILAATASGCPA
jgi:hypothetical protein